MDSSKKDSFQDHFTSFKTIVDRVNSLNPRYMVPANEATLVISDPKSMKKVREGCRTAVQWSTASRITIQPHLRGAWISDNQQYQGPPGTVPQQLRLHWWHARWVWHQDQPRSPASPAWQTEGAHRVQGGDQEGVSRDGLSGDHHQTDWAHTMGQQPNVSKEGKWQAEDLPWP